MPRSVWKGPFVDGYLLAKADAARASTRNEIIIIWSRRSTTLNTSAFLSSSASNAGETMSGAASWASEAICASFKRTSRKSARKRAMDGTKIITSASSTKATVSRKNLPDRVLKKPSLRQMRMRSQALVRPAAFARP